MLDYKAIGRRIALYRKKAKITQGLLAEKLDVSDGYISQIERGTAKISLSRLDEISDILNIEIAYLLSDKSASSDSYINTEIYEIIKDWDSENVNILINLLMCADKQLNKK